MVLGADQVLMSDTSELGPIEPQTRFADGQGLVRWQPVQTYLDAYNEHTATLVAQPNNVAARSCSAKLDPAVVKLCEAAKARAQQSAEYQLRTGMFRDGGTSPGGNWSRTASALLDTDRWISHSQMISWEDARDPHLGLSVQHLDQESEDWRDYWRLYCLQRIAIRNDQKIYESGYASHVIDVLSA